MIARLGSAWSLQIGPPTETDSVPISSYFNGGGDKVMKNMKKEYGKDAKKVFYSTANKRGLKPKGVSNGKRAHGK